MRLHATQQVSCNVLTREQPTKFVWDLMEDEGYDGADAQGKALRYGHPQGYPISEVVEAVSHDHQHGQGLDVTHA